MAFLLKKRDCWIKLPHIMCCCRAPRPMKTSFIHSTPHLQVDWSWVCVYALCVVTDQCHYATERNDAVSPLQSPYSLVPLLPLFLSSPLYTRPNSSHLVSVLGLNNAAQCPHTDEETTQTEGGKKRDLEQCEWNQSRLLCLLQINCYTEGSTRLCDVMWNNFTQNFVMRGFKQYCFIWTAVTETPELVFLNLTYR